MSPVRDAAKRLLEDRLGRSLRRRDSIRYGDDWTIDLRHFLGAGRHCFLDVGANEGQTARALLATFPDAEIHSFEPIPETYAILSAGLAGTGVRTVRSAVGDSVGEAKIYMGSRSGVAGFHSTGAEAVVPVTTVDAYVRDHLDGPLGLLKIDTEGHEIQVLEGAAVTLGAGDIDNVLCECDFDTRVEEPHGDFAAIHEILRGHGYRVVATYCEGVDNLGWLWGDVLWHRVGDERRQSDAISTSPFDRRRL